MSLKFLPLPTLHRSANNGFVFLVEKLWVVSGIIFDVESECGIRTSLSRQDFEIFEVMCSKNGIFRYFWGYVQGARNFFGFFLGCHHLALLFPFKISYWTVTSDFFSQRYGHIKFWHLSKQPYEHSVRHFKTAGHLVNENINLALYFLIHYIIKTVLIKKIFLKHSIINL